MSRRGDDKQPGKPLFSQYAVQQQTPFDVEKLANKHRHQDRGWTIPEAYLGLMIAAANADGRVDTEEESEIDTVARRSRALRSLSPEVLAAAKQGARQRFAQDPGAALEDACKTLPAELCLPAFTHCADIVLSDGEMLEAEAQWLQNVMPKLDIDDDHGRRIIEVLLLKARY